MMGVFYEKVAWVEEQLLITNKYAPFVQDLVQSTIQELGRR